MVSRRDPLRVEILLDGGVAERGRVMLHALAGTASRVGVDVRMSPIYLGDSEWLILYGIGAPGRQEIARRHRDAGGRVIAWDLGYWGREKSSEQARQRVTIDAPHPQAWVMRRDWPAERFERLLVSRAPLGDPAGPVVIAGMGPKSCVQYRCAPLDWPKAAMEIAARRWPERKIIYRPKKPSDPVPAGVPVRSGGEIQDVLAGASLVLTNHSNVAVDALCVGIPALVKDGAAAAICGRPADGAAVMPELEILERFLRNLAWFQWSPVEALAGDVWPFLRELIQR